MTKFIEHRNGSRKVTKPIVIFFHANCTDGFSAAWAAWKKFGVKAEYRALFHEDALPKGLRGKEIYTLDMTFPEPVTKKLMRENRRVTAIDHHISSKRVTQMTQHYSYTLDHSGAVLAWKYFHPTKPVPRMLLSVEDMDLWRFKIPGTRELYGYLDLFDFDFHQWSRHVRDFENPKKRKTMFIAGHTVVQYEERLFDRQVSKNAHLIMLVGKKILAINATGAFRSGLGNRLAQASPSHIGIVWWQTGDGMVAASLRSVGNADVSKIAEKFGGGGHKHSASFRLKSIKDIPWKPINN